MSPTPTLPHTFNLLRVSTPTSYICAMDIQPRSNTLLTCGGRTDEVWGGRVERVEGGAEGRLTRCGGGWGGKNRVNGFRGGYGCAGP